MKKMIAGVCGLGLTCMSSFVTETAVAAADTAESTAPAVVSSGIDWTGDVSVKYQRNTMDGQDNVDGLMYTLRLNGEKQFSHGFSLYARLGAQYATQPVLGDFNTDAYSANKKGVLAIDMFGAKYKHGNFSYKLGRQDLTIGTTSLLYSRPDSNIGIRHFVDGLTFEGTTGKLDLNGAFVQEDNDGPDDNRLFALHGDYHVMKDLNAGITIGRYFDKTDNGGNSSHIAADSTYRFGKHTLTAEVAKSNADTENKAFAVNWNYDLDGKTSVYITAFRVETNADMRKQSDFDNDNKGFYYGIVHQFTKNDSLEIKYRDQKTITDDLNNTKLEATLTHTL